MQGTVTLKHVKVRGGSWKNFAGAKTDFNDKGRRNFCAFITADQADELENYGVNVKHRLPREEGDEEEFYVKVNVNFQSNWPPRIYICTRDNNGEMNETQIDEHDVACLDSHDIEYANLIVNLNESNNPRFGRTVTAYLRSGAFVVSDREEDNLFDWRS